MVQRPNGWFNAAAVVVNHDVAAVDMAGEVDFSDVGGVDGVNPSSCIAPMGQLFRAVDLFVNLIIQGIDVNIVHVDQQLAASALRQSV